MGTGIRDFLAAISPPWLFAAVGDLTAVAGKYVYAMGLADDALIQKQQWGQEAHMPTVCDPTALPLIGDDRVILRGFAEGDDAYRVRLQRAFETWQHAGSSRSDIGALLGYLTPFAPIMRIVSNGGNWDFTPAGATPDTIPTHLRVVPTNWHWDGGAYADAASLWFRSWVIVGTGVWVKNDPIGTPGRKFGDRIGTIGCNATRNQVRSVQALVKTWKSAHTYVPWIILSFDDTWFSPWLPPGDAKLPDGLWGPWHKVVGGVAVRSRTSNAAYWDGAI